MENIITALQNIIIAQQEVIGPVAVNLAHQVEELSIQEEGKNIKVSINGDPAKALAELVEVYADLFGDASISLSLESVNIESLGIPVEELPPIIRSKVKSISAMRT